MPHEENAKLLGSAGGRWIRVVAERGARVQRAVDDDLQRPNDEQPAGAVDDGPGVQVLRNGVVESLRPHGAGDAQRSIAVRHPAPPRLERPRLLHVHDADNASSSRGPRRGVAPRIGDLIGNHPDLTDDPHRRVLAQQPGRVARVSEPAERGSAEPRAVQIGTDEHHRQLAAHLVQHLAMRRIRPERIAKSVSDHGHVEILLGAGDVRRNKPRRCGCGVDTGKIETRPDLRPLVEVHMAVPEPGQQKPAIDIDHLCRLRSALDVADFSHMPVGNQDVLGWRLRREARLTEQNGRQCDGTTTRAQRGPL